MKRSALKAIGFLLALALAFGGAVPAFAGLDGNYNTPIPTVYLQGQGSTLYADKDDIQSEQIQDIVIPDGYIGDAAKEMVGPLLRGLTLNQWDTWCDMLVDAVAPLFEKQALDRNGEASNGSGIYTSSGNVNLKNADGTYRLGAYMPMYDWRLDPCAIADEIHTYIGQVKEATKAEKVNLIGRSIGASVVMAYLEKYGMEDIDTTVLYCPSFYGMEVFSKAFAGKIHIDSAAVERFASWYVNSGKANGALGEGNDDLLSVMLDIVSRSVELRAMDLPMNTLQRIYSKVYENVLPRLMVKTYGSMPGFWSLVGDEDYDEAKELIFGGQEAEYAGLIEKIDAFHENVLNRSEEIIKDLADSGHKVQIVVKTGVPMVPFVENADMNSDMLTSVWSAAGGAECAPLGKTLPAEYQMAASRKGAWKYISPEKDIDASTGFLPDHTWYIKDLDHRSMPEGVNVLFETMLNDNGYMTVFDNETLPQYLKYNADTDSLSVLTAPEETEAPGPFRAFFIRLRNYFRNILTILRKVFPRG